jgi:hypothetical protein
MDPIWLDVPTKRAFDNEILDADPSYIKQPGLQLLYIDLVQYHRIPKTRLAHFPQRIMALRNLSRLAKSVDLPDAEWVRKWVGEWIVAQAEKKANYLEILQDYFRENEHEVRNPGLLLDRLKAARSVVSMPLAPKHVGASQWKTAKPGETLIGLHGGVRMEQIDPLHRVYEFRMMGDQIHGASRQQELALQEWATAVRAGTYNEPFFVYIEGAECCVVRNTNRSDILGLVEFPGIKYFTGLGPNAPGIYQIAIHNGVAFRIDGHGYGAMFDTNSITPEQSPKGTRDEAHGRKTMAYNWTKHGELLVGVHKEYELHHSSFQSGGLIRCAGMIGARQGKIYWIDNDSGHYRPPPMNLHRFIVTLKDSGVLAPDARVFNAAAKDGSVQKQVTGMAVEQYLANPSGRSFAIGGHRAPPSTKPTLGGHRST